MWLDAVEPVVPTAVSGYMHILVVDIGGNTGTALMVDGKVMQDRPPVFRVNGNIARGCDYGFQE